jgi:hypothetical protein
MWRFAVQPVFRLSNAQIRRNESALLVPNV